MNSPTYLLFDILCWVTDYGYRIEVFTVDLGEYIVRVNIAAEGNEFIFFHSVSDSSVRVNFPLPEHIVRELEEHKCK